MNVESIIGKVIIIALVEIGLYAFFALVDLIRTKGANRWVNTLMTKDIATASIYQRVMAWEFAKVAEGIQISVIVAIAVYIAGIQCRLNYLLNMMNLSC